MKQTCETRRVHAYLVLYMLYTQKCIKSTINILNKCQKMLPFVSLKYFLCTVDTLEFWNWWVTSLNSFVMAPFSQAVFGIIIYEYVTTIFFILVFYFMHIIRYHRWDVHVLSIYLIGTHYMDVKLTNLIRMYNNTLKSVLKFIPIMKHP